MTHVASPGRRRAGHPVSRAIDLPPLRAQTQIDPTPQERPVPRFADSLRGLQIETPFGTANLVRFLAIWAALVILLVAPALL